METALTIVKPDAEAYEPRDIAQALHIADVMVKSRLLGSKVTTPEQAFVIMATGKELGLTAMQSLRSIHVIEGKPSCSADLILALCKREPRICKYFRLVRSDEKVATYETHREGESRPTTLSFTIDEAKQAQLTGKDNWRKYPAAMLRARCIAALARAVYPDLVLGIYETDEMESRNGATREIRVETNEGAATPHAEAERGGQELSPTSTGGADEATPVTPSRSTAAGPDPVSPVVAAFNVQIEGARTVAAMDAISSAIGAAHKAKAITDEDRKGLIAPYLEKRKVLEAVEADKAAMQKADAPAEAAA